jgi:hypothetical protein
MKSMPRSLVNVNDIRMVQGAGGAGLLEKARSAFGVGDFFGGQDLDGDKAVQMGVAGFVYDAHAALAELVEDVIMTNRPANHQHYPGIPDLDYVIQSNPGVGPEQITLLPGRGYEFRTTIHATCSITTVECACRGFFLPKVA